jgi:hypothetical protein
VIDTKSLRRRGPDYVRRKRDSSSAARRIFESSSRRS